MAANKPKISKRNHTPEIITNLIVATINQNPNMAKDFEMYGNYSNAYLALFPGHIDGPVWCMDLYVGKQVHLAILEEFMSDEDLKYNLAIFTGSLKPTVIFEEGQVWEHECKKDDVTIHQVCRLYQNKKGENCLKITYLRK